MQMCASADAGSVGGIDMTRLLNYDEFLLFLVRLADYIFGPEGQGNALGIDICVVESI